MEFKELLSARRSTRKFTDRAIPREVIDGLLRAALSAPSARNTRSTQLFVVDSPTMIARMATMRDYGSAFMAGAPLVFVVAGDTTRCDLWRENCAIAATILQLSCVDEGLASCWVHVDGRPRLKESPEGATAADYLRDLLSLPASCEPLCALVVGYSDHQPAPLPASDDAARVTWVR